MDIKDFRTPQSVFEAKQMITAAAVILRAAYAEVASCNAICAREVFSANECKNLEKYFNGIIKLMSSAVKAYDEEYGQLSTSKESAN